MSHPAEPVDLILDESPDATDIDALRVGLTEHSQILIGDPGFKPIAVFARAPDGSLVGGAYGFLNWSWLDLSLLWVAESQRGQGLGSRLVQRIEVEAWLRGCRHAHLETFSYQAREFYERHGYEAFAELPDYPPGHIKVYLRKPLSAPPADRAS